MYQGVFVSFIATSMKLCWVKVSATQFAIYMAFANLGRSVGTGSVGTLESRLAYNEMYFLVAIGILRRGPASLEGQLFGTSRPHRGARTAVILQAIKQEGCQ